MKDKAIQAYFMRVDDVSGIPYRGYLGTIENALSAEQRYVNFDEPGGHIQVVPLDADILVICHEDGMALDFPANRAWIDSDGEVVDLFAGNIMAVRRRGEEFSSILASDVPYIERYLRPVALLPGGVCVPILNRMLLKYKEEQ